MATGGFQSTDIIDIKHTGDLRTPSPNSITFLKANDIQTLVLTDYNNKCLKSVRLQCKERTLSVLKLSDNPLRIAKMTGNKVAATVNSSCIVIAEVRPELVLISNLTTSKQYFGITSLPDSTLAVGTLAPPSVEVLDLGGNVLRSLNQQNTGLSLIQLPSYLCTTTEGNILVSEYDTAAVYCLSPKGDVEFDYTPTGERTLKRTQGVTVTGTGDILLSDSGSKKIIQLTSAGTFVRDLLMSVDGIGRVCDLCVGDGNVLYLCDKSSDNECIKVFQLT